MPRRAGHRPQRLLDLSGHPAHRAPGGGSCHPPRCHGALHVRELRDAVRHPRHKQLSTPWSPCTRRTARTSTWCHRCRSPRADAKIFENGVVATTEFYLYWPSTIPPTSPCLDAGTFLHDAHGVVPASACRRQGRRAGVRGRRHHRDPLHGRRAFLRLIGIRGPRVPRVDNQGGERRASAAIASGLLTSLRTRLAGGQ